MHCIKIACKKQGPQLAPSTVANSEFVIINNIQSYSTAKLITVTEQLVYWNDEYHVKLTIFTVLIKGSRIHMTPIDSQPDPIWRQWNQLNPIVTCTIVHVSTCVHHAYNISIIRLGGVAGRATTMCWLAAVVARLHGPCVCGLTAFTSWSYAYYSAIADQIVQIFGLLLLWNWL